MWPLILWASAGLVTILFLFARRVSEKGVRIPRRAPRPAPYVAPLTRTELLALAKRDYFDQLAEIPNLHLDQHAEAGLREHLYQKYINRINGVMG